MIKETIPFNFDELYNATQLKFIENGYDTQEGSNTSQLITAMAYLISMLNSNTAVNVNENLLTLARKRNNILQDARVLGYEPAGKVSYQYNLELTIPAGDFILPKYAEFTSGDKKYYYFGDIITLTDLTADYKLNIIVKEGTLLKSSDNTTLNITTTNFIENGVTKPQYYIDIPFTDIEDDGIEAFLTYYDNDGVLFNKEEWKEIETFTVDSDTILNKQYYRLNRIGYNTPRIFFKLPNTSDSIRLGTQIEMNVLQSSGSSGAAVGNFIPTLLNCTVTSYSLKIQGTEEETNTSIKQNAPLFWNSANRAITKNDYKSICERLTLVDKSYIWDGNSEYPKIPGKIWFSFIPGTYTRQYAKNAFKTIFALDLIEDEENWFLEEAEINNILNEYLDVYKIPTMELLHRHPIHIDFDFEIQILKYGITTLESTQNEIIFDIIDNYFARDVTYKLEDFGTEFFKSNLIKRIDSQVSDITGVNLSLKNSITLYNKNIVDENSQKKIILSLGLPYEKYYDNNGDLITSILPNIDTLSFIDNKNLSVDWTSLTGNEKQKEIVQVDIMLGTDIVGSYTIFNLVYIRVELNIDGVLITEENIEQKLLNVKYLSDNIRITKNMIPRLKGVIFI